MAGTAMAELREAVQESRDREVGGRHVGVVAWLSACFTRAGWWCVFALGGCALGASKAGGCACCSKVCCSGYAHGQRDVVHIGVVVRMCVGVTKTKQVQ